VTWLWHCVIWSLTWVRVYSKKVTCLVYSGKTTRKCLLLSLFSCLKSAIYSLTVLLLYTAGKLPGSRSYANLSAQLALNMFPSTCKPYVRRPYVCLSSWQYRLNVIWESYILFAFFILILESQQYFVQEKEKSFPVWLIGVIILSSIALIVLVATIVQRYVYQFLYYDIKFTWTLTVTVTSSYTVLEDSTKMKSHIVLIVEEVLDSN
jgi:hypothetical protein